MVSSARNPNESYADRARKASTSSTTQTTIQNNSHPIADASSLHPPSSLKPPQVNVWAERIKEKQAPAASQPVQMPRQRATSSPQPHRDDAIHPRSPPPADLSAQLAILDEKDEHDPFVVRVPPYLSRQSSSSTNPLPITDPNVWPLLPGTVPHSSASSAGYDSPFLSAPPSRQNSTASVRHHGYSLSGSVCLPGGAQSAFSQHSRSASHSGAQSRSGSSASSPRLQFRSRTLPQDDSLPDLRLDVQHRRSSNNRSSPALPDPSNHISTSFQIDIPADPSGYRRPPIPSSQDMSPRYTHNLVSQYALAPPFPLAHVPGHTSPPYIPPHSGQGTPPYPHYPPFPTYMYGHPPYLWGDIASQPHSHFQNQPSNPTSPSDHAVGHKIEFGSVSPAITTEPGTSIHQAQFQNGAQPKPPKSVVFGTINPAGPQGDPGAPSPTEEHPTDATIEHATEQFTTFSIGVGPDELGPSRHASRRSSVKSLSKTPSSQPTTSDGSKDADGAPPPPRGINGIKRPIKWEFGTTHSEDFEEAQLPSSPSPLSTSAPLNHQSQPADDGLDTHNIPLSHGTSQANRSTDKSETTSTASDVWVVKDFGYGFGHHSGCGNAPDLVRWEMRERERARARENQREREMFRDQHRDRAWVPPRQSAWRPENGVEEGKESLAQQVHVDVPRHMRPRRGSFSGYGGHDRGGYTPRRGRGFGGRFHGGRGRGGFFHHQRPGSYPYVPPPPPPPQPPLEALHQPPIDSINGYGPYAPPELEPYEAAPQARVPYTPTAYSVDGMRNSLLSQLEYYLSPQNMAQDFYLRQRMDNKGWIPISLLASFKRVQQLQTDADIVKDVLSQSATVEVSRDWVRMGMRQWELFVLPNAPRSMVTGTDHSEGETPRADPHEQGDAYAEHGGIDGELEGDCDGEDCEGDDEDDEIEFVIGEEAEGSWMVPERKL